MKLSELDIPNLPAGPELDALIAEYVMGEPKPPTPQHDFHLDPINSDKANWYCLLDYDDGDECSWTPFHFSTNITAAWPIAEKLLITVAPYSNGQFHAADGKVIAFADTAPLAICRCALKVIEWTKEHVKQY